MVELGLNLGQEPQPALIESLAAAGFVAATDGDARLRLISAATLDRPAAEGVVRFVLAGGGLLVCGATGPLLASLNLTASPELCGGAASPVATGLPPLTVESVPRVTGVGYVLYRVDDRCIAVGGMRGEGCVAYIGSDPPPPALAVACLRWLCGQVGLEARGIF